MTTISGPKIQMPSALSSMFSVDPEGNVMLHQDAASFFHSLQQTSFNTTRSGPSTSRPTSKLEGRWIGMNFYDTTLGKPIYLHSVNPDVWHDGAGNVV